MIPRPRVPALRLNKTALALTALVFAALGVVAHRALNPPPDAGAPGEVQGVAYWDAPLPDLAGRPHRLGQWRGKVLLVNFWAPWCPPCRQEIPGFVRLQARLGARGLQFVGVALDEPGRVRAYMREAGINYPVLIGGEAGAQLSRDMGNRLGGLPYSVLFDRQGRPVAALIGDLAETRLEALVKPLL